MTDDWGRSIQKSGRAREILSKAMAGNNIKEILAAMDFVDECEKEEEIETVKAGHISAWPPKTDEGLAKWGCTRDQVNDWLARPRN